MSDLPDLPDRPDLPQFTSHQLLLAAAQEGARIRAVAEYLKEVTSTQQSDGPELGALDSEFFGVEGSPQTFFARFLRELPDNPRGIVIVARSECARAAAQAAQSIVPDPGCPVVIAETLPRYVGALDGVVILTPDPLDRQASAAIDHCRRVGASTLIVAPPEGPVADAAAEFALLCPDIPGVQGESFGRYLAGAVALFGLFRQLPLPGLLDDAASCVDAEMYANGPSRDVAVNPARALAQTLSGHRILLAGSANARWIAEFGMAAFLNAGQIVAATDTAKAARDYGRLVHGDKRSIEVSADEDPVFYDPFLDGPALLPLEVVVVPESDTMYPHLRAEQDQEGPLSEWHSVGNEEETGAPAGAQGDDEERSVVSTETIERLESFFDGKSITMMDVSTTAHTPVAYLAVSAARLMATAAYLMDEDLRLED